LRAKQLRHDTLLYAKQTYIPSFLCSYPEAFGEPYPKFYSRMRTLIQRTIKAIQILDSSKISPAVTLSLETLETVAEKTRDNFQQRISQPTAYA
jgi:hypothetical protein